MQLTDNHRRPLRSGEIYADSRSLDSSTSRFPEVYYVFRESRKWTAKDARGRFYEVSYPKGLPDSAIMPDGQIDASDLVRLSRTKVYNLLEKMRICRTTVSETILFLEQRHQK